MAVARKILSNPANRKQRYILYANGYIQAIGGALPIVQSEASINTWSVGSGAPVGYSSQAEGFVSFQILSWSAPSGYTLDIWGNVWPWGGATVIPGASTPLTGGPEFLFGTNGGFSSPIYGYVIDFQMDPNGGGTGYLLLYNGDVVGVGTGVTAVAHGPAIPDSSARQLLMDWTSKRYWILDNLGRISGYNGGNSPAIVDTAGNSFTYPAYVWGRGGLYAQGGARLYDKSANPLGYVVDAFGRVYRAGAALDAPGYEFTPNARQWVDLEIIDDGTGVNPLRIVTLTAQGRQREYVVSTPPAAIVTEPSTTLTTANKPWIGWQYVDREGDAQQSYDTKILSSAVYLAGTTNEVQSLNQTGAPTGGSVKLGFQVSAEAPVASTVSIANNASAATVQAALVALPNIGAGGVTCAGGPWGTAPITVTFAAQMAGWNWPQITLVQNAFTGGASPTIAISTTTPGVGVDPATSPSVFSQSAGSADAPDTTNRVRTVDLPNSTTYRAYARATDTSGKTGSWTFKQFSTAFTALNVPVVVPTALGGRAGVSLAVSAATGAGLPAGSRFAVQYQDSLQNGLAGGLVLDGLTNSVVTTPDSATWDITGVMRIACRCAAAKWASGADQMLLNHWEVTGNNRSWALIVDSTGKLNIRISGDGSTVPVNTPMTPASFFVDWQTYWLGVEYNTATGATVYYFAPDSEVMPTMWTGWNQISSHSLTAVTPFAAGNALTFGGLSGFFGSRFTGVLYEAALIDDGVVVANPDFSSTATVPATPGAATSADPEGNIWTVRGTSYIQPQMGSWRNVRNGDALAPSASGAASVADAEGPYGQIRNYRAATYVYDSAADAYQQSSWSAMAQGENPTQDRWTLSVPSNPALGLDVRVMPGFKITAPVVGATFAPAGRQDLIVLTDGAPKTPKITLPVRTLSNADRQRLEACVNSGATMLLRDPLGHAWYVRTVDNFEQSLIRADPVLGENSVIRDAWENGLELQAVKRPRAGPLTGPLVEV